MFMMERSYRVLSCQLCVGIKVRKKEMRIEFVTDTFPPDINGVAMTLGRLTAMLRRQGHYVHVIHTGSEATEDETATAAFSFPGYKEVKIGLPRPQKLRRRWRKKRPDAVYVACESLMGVSAMKAARELKIPVVAGFHTNFHQYFKKYFTSITERPALKLLRRIHNPCECTMVPSQYMKDLLEEEGFVNLKVLGRGVDNELFSPERRSRELRESWGAADNDCVIIIVGRVAIEKNLPWSLKVINELREEYGNTNRKIKLVVIGDGPLKSSLSDKYSGDDFYFVGMRLDEDLAVHYASSDVMLFASETETFGNVLLEALASGLVTVSYDYAASAIHIKDGVNGFCAPLSDESALRDKLRKAIEHKDDVEIRKAARATTGGLSWASVATRFSQHVAEIVSEQPVTERRIKHKTPLSVRSLFLSDIHLGTESSRAKEVADVIKNVSCEKLYLNGDIIDGWALKRKVKWKKSHTKVIRAILKKSSSKDCEVIYTRGNHDDFLTPFLPSMFGDLRIVKEHSHETEDGKRYLVIHGDGFDSVSTNHHWLAKMGAVGYDFLLGVNRVHNKYRSWRGKGNYSIAKRVKAKVKGALTFIDKYEEQLYDLAKRRGYDGIICGHIHTPANKMVEDIHYLNSGDWVETMSCIVEHHDGRFELLSYEDLLEKFDLPRIERVGEELGQSMGEIIVKSKNET